MVLWRVSPAEPSVESPHRRSELQPHCLCKGENGRCLCPQIQHAVEFKVHPDIARGILPGHHLAHALVDRLKPVDQCEMRPRKRARGQFGFEQRSQRCQFLDPFGRGGGRRNPSRGRQLQSAFCREPTHRFPCRGRRDAMGPGDAAQGQRFARSDFAMHDLGADRPVDTVMRGTGRVRQSGNSHAVV